MLQPTEKGTRTITLRHRSNIGDPKNILWRCDCRIEIARIETVRDHMDLFRLDPLRLGGEHTPYIRAHDQRMVALLQHFSFQLPIHRLRQTGMQQVRIIIDIGPRIPEIRDPANMGKAALERQSDQL